MYRGRRMVATRMKFNVWYSFIHYMTIWFEKKSYVVSTWINSNRYLYILVYKKIGSWHGVVHLARIVLTSIHSRLCRVSCHDSRKTLNFGRIQVSWTSSVPCARSKARKTCCIMNLHHTNLHHWFLIVTSRHILLEGYHIAPHYYPIPIQTAKPKNVLYS